MQLLLMRVRGRYVGSIENWSMVSMVRSSMSRNVARLDRRCRGSLAVSCARNTQPSTWRDFVVLAVSSLSTDSVVHATAAPAAVGKGTSIVLQMRVMHMHARTQVKS